MSANGLPGREPLRVCVCALAGSLCIPVSQGEPGLLMNVMKELPKAWSNIMTRLSAERQEFGSELRDVKIRWIKNGGELGCIQAI